MSAFHQVVFTGRLKPGVNAEQAARDFAAVFKLPEEKAWRLILDGGEHVLKREVDDSNAERYREVLEEIGLEVRVEPAGTPLGGSEPAAEALAADETGSGTDTPPDAAAAGAAAPRAVSTNPYAPPQADLTRPADDDGPLAEPQSLPAGHGWLWLKDAYALFRSRPGTWLGAIAIIYLINFAVGLVPLVGSLVGFVLGPVFGGGIMAGARSLDRHGKVRAGMVFDGFSGPGMQLALVGVLYLLGIVLVMLAAGLIAVAAGVVTPAGLQSLSGGDPEAAAMAMAPTALSLLFLVALALLIPLLMAYWFAPALVMLEDLTALEAMQTSFRGCWMNIVPFLIYGLSLLGIVMVFSVGVGLLAMLGGTLLGPAAGVLGFLLVVVMVPVLLGFAVVTMLSQYTGYRDIFRHAG
ncbi:hypothetical protein CKO31_21680 [Thiohalocapsa halophila]|uniref:DUF2189 domain-containing protein n=1 Tax=Thiohalocapsa halophila TaxID=69359 RepID=A0ABS1CMZ3_9GAMM|nr:BPSS1780 family membrane protein [Thiohalocapsa halophila]MBK1633316.1 hypothetical protein [Thiohalocapsa halophila]